ncbi:MAG: malectin [Gammaproteobacteria bacterium]|jgi:hypothetical protein
MHFFLSAAKLKRFFLFAVPFFFQLASPAHAAPGLATPIRINAGGDSYTDVNGNLWLADSGYNTGRLASVSSKTIAGTADDRLYQTARWDEGSGPELKYSFAVPSGSYRVRLHFAETWRGALSVGKRVFDIDIEGRRATDNLDVFEEVGGYTALVKTYNVTVEDGQLDIELIHNVENPSINAIEIIGDDASNVEPESVPESGGSSQVIRINAGGDGYTDVNGNLWLSDSGYNTGRLASVSSKSIAATADDYLYQTARWDEGSGPELKYSFAVASGSYRVRLHFAETWRGALSVGKRVFDIDIEGRRVTDNLDVFKEVGGYTALVKTYNVTVGDGRLDIELIHDVENPSITAIEIIGDGVTDSTASTSTTADTGTTNLTSDGTTGSTDTTGSQTGTGDAELSWVAPTTRSNGDPLQLWEIAGYTLLYGTNRGEYDNAIRVNDAYTNSITVSDLPSGTYYFVVTTRDVQGLESAYSGVARRVVP